MRLNELIIDDMEGILADFEDFARTHTTSGASMPVDALRDHAEDMLRAFAADMSSPQTGAEQKSKSHGDAPIIADAPPTAASKHGRHRADAGFTLQEMFAEYRALRASVLRHWVSRVGDSADPLVQDMIRFNEAIDQAVAESITRYSAAVDEHREMFLGVLGHDLRTPLSAVLTAAEFLAEDGRLDARSHDLALTITRSGERMNLLVNDLLDFTQSRLGGGIPIRRSPADLGRVVRQAVDEIRVLCPDRQLQFESAGDLHGEYDAARVSQAVSNLVVNALQHGDSDRLITIVVHDDGPAVVLAVRNRGVIPARMLPHIFEPFRRGRPLTEEDRDARSVGLGLHIARQIALAHGGTLEVDSSADRGTTFTIRLPRREAAAEEAQSVSPPARLRASER